MRTIVKLGVVATIVAASAIIFAQEAMVTRGQQTAKEEKVATQDEQKGPGVEPNIGITQQNRQAVAKILNALLSDEYLLYVKTQNYHWNVTGLMFNDLHLFFGKQYDELSHIVDTVAERVRALGFRAMGTMEEFNKNARLKEQVGIVPEAKEMIKNLLEDHEAIIRSLRTDIELCAQEHQDIGTDNFLAELITRHEKMAWMLRSYLA